MREFWQRRHALASDDCRTCGPASVLAISCEIYQLGQVRDSCNLVGLLRRPHLPQRQYVGGGTGADHVKGRFARMTVVGPPQHLAIDDDDLPIRCLASRLDPGQEARLKGLRVKARKHAPDRVVRWNAVLKIQELAQPPLPHLPKGFDGREAIGPVDNSADGERHNVTETMLFAFGLPGVFDDREVRSHVVDSRCAGWGLACWALAGRVLFS